MKKYLMTGIAALAIGGTFTSCGPDMSSYSGNPTEQVVQNYENKFVQAFGEPAPNQTWGFGSSTVVGIRGMTRASDDYDGYKGSLQPMESYQDPNDGWKWKTRPLPFPSDCDASNFDPDLTGVKSYKEIADAANQGGGFATGICYIDENHTGKIHIWGGSTRAKLYFKAGTYDFTNETFGLCADADLYLLSGATVTLNNAAASTAKFDVYIAPGAKLIANGQDGYKADVDAHLYNHGTIECTRFEVNGTGSLYNVGALKVPSGDVYIANSTSRIVNDGTINAASTHVEGSGALQNNAEWNVTGNTIVSCTNGAWVNNGHWTTQNYGYTAGSVNVINNCFLEVTEDFDINTSQNSTASFKIDTGGGVLTKNFNGGKVISDPNSVSGPYKIIMGNKSVFKVTETATLEGGNKGWGFFGPTDGEYAVFQAKNVVRAAGLENTQGAVTYSGNLYVSAETHFAQGHDGQDSDGHYFINELGGFSVNTNIYASGFKAGTPDITIPTTPCNPGFPAGGSDDKESIRVIGEDLTVNDANSDFDFNDIVFDVIRNKTTGKVSVKFLAAGGELPIYIGPDDNSAWELHGLFADKEKEVAEKEGKTARNITTKTMMNTAKDKQNGNVIRDAYKCPEKELPDSWWDGDNIQDIANSIEIRVQKSGTLFILKAPEGKAPSKIAVDTDYDWCGERDNINTIYGKFNDYVKHNSYAWNEWYK